MITSTKEMEQNKMTKQEQAYEIGYNAAKAGTATPPCFSKEICDLVAGMAVDTGAADIYKAYTNGVMTANGL